MAGPPDRDRAIETLQDRLGHRFHDPALLERALCHGSATGPRSPVDSNERLEFLGDRVLGLAIAALLYDQNPGEREGSLARRLNALVRRETCADVALTLGIDRALRLGGGEDEAGGRQKQTILADACEAVLAAVFLDGGWPAASGVVARTWRPLMKAHPTSERDAKTALQEKVQAAGGEPPAYTVLARKGPDHAPHFVIEVVTTAGERAIGEGSSKREAEQAAARKLLEGA